MKKFAALLLFWLGIFTFCQAQTDSLKHLNAKGESVKDVTDAAYDVPAEFPVGGRIGMAKYIISNLKVPARMPEKFEEVWANFEIDADGKVKNIRIEQAWSHEFAMEVERVFKSMPDWKPAMRDGIRVSQVFRVPVSVNFKSTSTGARNTPKGKSSRITEF